MNCLIVILQLHLKLKKKQSMEKKPLKILTPKQMLQRLTIAFVQVKASNSSEDLLNEIRQIISFLYLEKEITKKYIAIQ